VIRRPWTRLGVLAIGSHLAYELVAGVGVPLASRVGVTAWLTECEGLEDRLIGLYIVSPLVLADPPTSIERPSHASVTGQLLMPGAAPM
jgi:hypothetical protein